MNRTKERLAQVLHAVGLFDMERKVRAGEYDDYESPNATPIINLVSELRQTGRNDLAQRAMNGEWDGTKEEADEWFEKEGRSLLGEAGREGE